MSKKIFTLSLSLLLFLNVVIIDSAGIASQIDVMFDRINIEVNGTRVDQSNILYNDTTYVPLRAVAELLGKEVTWEQSTSSAGINDLSNKEIEIRNKVDAYKPKIPLELIGVGKENIEAVELELTGETVFVNYTIEDENIVFENRDSNKSNVLNVNDRYTINVFTKNEETISATFVTTDLPVINETGEYEIFYIEANPEKGFNFPYIISLPSNTNKTENANKERYLIVEPNNYGRTSNDYDKHVEDALEGIYDPYPSYELQEELWLPRLMPIFPRPDIWYNGRGAYTHSLDSYTIFMDEWFEEQYRDSRFVDVLINEKDTTKEEVEKMYNIDEQLNAMIDHAIDLLNDNGQDVNEEKIFMYGFSASGNFVNRYITLYPERVKAAYAGALNSIVMMPGEELDGDKLIYPIGTADNLKITGSEFDLEAYNKVAKIFYMGALDNNDTLDYSEPYETKEKDLIIKHFGQEMLPTRWDNTKRVFFEFGGSGAFVTNLNKGHGGDIGDTSYMIKMFDLNRDSVEPVYPQSTYSHIIVETK